MGLNSVTSAHKWNVSTKYHITPLQHNQPHEDKSGWDVVYQPNEDKSGEDVLYQPHEDKSGEGGDIVS